MNTPSVNAFVSVTAQSMTNTSLVAGVVVIVVAMLTGQPAGGVAF